DAAAGQLPKDLPRPPSYRKINPADSPILIYAVHSDTLPLTTVDDYAENILVQQISRVSGVGQVSLGGQQKPAVRVQVDPAKMANMGVQLTDVQSVIQSATVDAAKGAINGTLHTFAIYDNDQLVSAKPWNDVVVAYRNGAPVRIKDIGQAVAGPENLQAAAYQNGKPGVLLMIFKQPGANVIDTAKRVEAVLPHAMASLPPAIKLDKINDRTVTINASVHDVEYTLMVTISLVVLVIFLFLRNVWATIIPGITVPLALFGTCAVMYVLGYSLDNLSLMALTIAVGFVGRLFREFAITVTLTIVVSAFVSLTLSPMMCALFLRDERHIRHGRLYEASERVFQRALRLYERGLDFVLRHQSQTLMVFFGTMVLAGALYVVEPKGFFPQEDTSLIKGLTDGSQDI